MMRPLAPLLEDFVMNTPLPPLPEQLGAVIEAYGSGQSTLDRIKDRLSLSFHKSQLSQWRHGHRKLPKALHEWVKKEYLSICTPFGSVTESPAILPCLSIASGCVRHALARETSEADLEAALDLVLRLQASHRGYPMNAEARAQLHAMAGVLYRKAERLPEAEAAFQAAVHALDQEPAVLRAYYETNLLNIRREQVFRRHAAGELPMHSYPAHLQATLTRQHQVLAALPRDAHRERALGLRHVLRLNALLDARPAFEAALQEARQCPGFGDTPEAIDQALFKLLDNDVDGDFAPARRYVGARFTQARFNDYLDRLTLQPNRPRSAQRRVSPLLGLAVLLFLAFPLAPREGLADTGNRPSPMIIGGDYGF